MNIIKYTEKFAYSYKDDVATHLLIFVLHFSNLSYIFAPSTSKNKKKLYSSCPK